MQRTNQRKVLQRATNTQPVRSDNTAEPMRVACRTHGQRMALLLLVIVAMVLRLYAAGTEDTQSPDAYQYARQAALLQTNGLAGLREEAARFATNLTMAAIPSVSRTVFLGALTGWMKLTQTSGVVSVAAFSCLLDIISVVLLAAAATELLGLNTALAAVALYAASPPVLSMARHGWSDSAAAMMCLLSIWFAGRTLTGAHRWSGPVLGVLTGVSFSVKETCFAACLIILLCTLALLARERRIADCGRLAVWFICAFCIMFAWTAFALGGAGRVFAVFGAGRDVHSVVRYAVEYQTGSPQDWLRALVLSDPLTFVLACAGTVLLGWKVYKREAVPGALLVCAMVLIVFVLLPMSSAAKYNVRFLAPIFAPACLLGAAALRGFYVRTSRSQLLAACTLCICTGLSFWRFQVLIAKPDLQDLSLRMLLTSHN